MYLGFLPRHVSSETLHGDAGEEARSAALATTSARLSSTNALLRDVAAIQRHTEDLCPGERHISDVMSEYSLDEPESSHAVHAVPSSSLTELLEAEPSCAVPAAADADTVVAQGSMSSTPDWACFGSLPVTVPLTSAPQDAVFHNPLAASVGHSSAQGEAGAGEVVEGVAESPMPAVGLSEPPVPEKRRPAVGLQESPLPAMMSELQEAMTASISSSGNLPAVSVGINILSMLSAQDRSIVQLGWHVSPCVHMFWQALHHLCAL